jgi:hypothetical protein
VSRCPACRRRRPDAPARASGTLADHRPDVLCDGPLGLRPARLPVVAGDPEARAGEDVVRRSGSHGRRHVHELIAGDSSASSVCSQWLTRARLCGTTPFADYLAMADQPQRDDAFPSASTPHLAYAFRWIRQTGTLDPRCITNDLAALAHKRSSRAQRRPAAGRAWHWSTDISTSLACARSPRAHDHPTPFGGCFGAT